VSPGRRPGERPELFEGVPYRYAAVAPAGGLLFTAGACPLDAQGAVIGPGDYEAQTRAVLRNPLAVLEAHGAGPGDLVKTTVYVVGDRSDLLRVWSIVEGAWAPHQPPSTLLGVSVLGFAGQLVEIEAIAALAATTGTA
jgi:enamine deaminase RidA (YjgF/YER057c/UK114 family)